MNFQKLFAVWIYLRTSNFLIDAACFLKSCNYFVCTKNEFLLNFLFASIMSRQDGNLGNI